MGIDILFDDSCGYSSHGTVGWNIFKYHCSCTDNTVIAYGHWAKYFGTCPNIDIVAYSGYFIMLASSANGDTLTYNAVVAYNGSGVYHHCDSAIGEFPPPPLFRNLLVQRN